MKKDNVDWDRLLTSKEAATLYNKEESYFRQLIRAEKLIVGIDCKQFGKTWIFDKKALDKYFKIK